MFTMIAAFWFFMLVSSVFIHYSISLAYQLTRKKS